MILGSYMVMQTLCIYTYHSSEAVILTHHTVAILCSDVKRCTAMLRAEELGRSIESIEVRVCLIRSHNKCYQGNLYILLFVEEAKLPHLGRNISSDMERPVPFLDRHESTENL
jgi:hypothetical protein